MDEAFGTFDREPIAAASIAQVHAATLTSGARVVVKVRRPDVNAIVERDLDIVIRLAGRLQRGTNWGRAVGAVELSHGFASALREELDLRIEARNMTSVATASAARGGGSVRVPVPHQPLSGQTVLVMERLDGRPLAAAEAGMPAEMRATLARSLLDSLLCQVMLDGTFHADPHPGNILLLTDGRLGLLDFGSVGRIDAGLRSALQRCCWPWTAAIQPASPTPCWTSWSGPEISTSRAWNGRWAVSSRVTSRPGSRPTSGCSLIFSASSPTTGWPCRRRSRRFSGRRPPWRAR